MQPNAESASKRLVREAATIAGLQVSDADSKTGNVMAKGLEGPEWPKPLAVEAFHGLAGDVVRTIEPHSEADVAALLIQFLAAFGVAAGRFAYFAVEADRHYPI